MESLNFLQNLDLQDTFYTTASGRTYAAVIGSNKDGLLLNIQFGIGGIAKVDGGIALVADVVVRSLIRGKTYATDFEWENREGENRLEKKVYSYCTTADQGQDHLFELLESSTFFKDLSKSLEFHGCKLTAEKIKERLKHTLPKLHTADNIICPKFAFNF